MKLKKINRKIVKWQKKGLIDSKLAETLFAYEKEESKIFWVKIINLLLILAGFWIFFGVVGTFINVLEVNWVRNFFIEIVNILKLIIIPVYEFIISILKFFAPDKYLQLGWGLFFLSIAIILFFVSEKQSVKEKIYDNTGENFFKSKILNGTTTKVISYLCFVSCVNFFYIVFRYQYFRNNFEILMYLPLVLGIFVFLKIAYKKLDKLALCFALLFFTQMLGLFFIYIFGAYIISVSWVFPQMFAGGFLYFVSKCHEKLYQNNNQQYLLEFADVYSKVGLLMYFISVWFLSIFGFSDGRIFHEIFFANIVFVLSSFGAFFGGTIFDEKILRGYGLVFMFLSTYTIFFSHVFRHLGASMGALCFGFMLLGTGKFLRKHFIQREINKK